MEYFVYILECSDRTLYTGITNHLEKRLEVHNKGAGAKYTRSRLPVKMVYHECQPSKSAALKREREIKSFSRRRKLQLIEKGEESI